MQGAGGLWCRADVLWTSPRSWEGRSCLDTNCTPLWSAQALAPQSLNTTIRLSCCVLQGSSCRTASTSAWCGRQAGGVRQQQSVSRATRNTSEGLGASWLRCARPDETCHPLWQCWCCCLSHQLAAATLECVGHHRSHFACTGCAGIRLPYR